jgi:hypothetical protein
MRGNAANHIGVCGFQFRQAAPELARDPAPADEATDLPRDGLVLGWTPGEYAAQHDVYLGTSFDDVNEATTGGDTYQGRQVASSFALPRLAFGTEYFWRIDEVNAPPDSTVFKGEVWSFTVESFSIMIPVDATKATASSSTDANPPSMTVNGSGLEGTTHSEDTDTMWLSAQGDLDPWLMVEFDQPQKLDKMLVWNSNSKSEGFIGWGIKDVNIEASIDGLDWTVGGAKTLSIVFNGQAGNTGTLFIMINNAKVTYQRDNGNISRGAWQAWNIDLATVNTTLSNVTRLTLGVEGAGTAGMILFDDIRLYPKAGEVITPTDPGSENLAGAWSFDEGSGTVAGDSSGHGRNGTIIDATWEDGILGKALNFNGSTAYVNIDGFKGINAVDGVQQPFTISNWIKTVSDGEMVTWGLQAAATRLSWRVKGGVLRTEHAAGSLRSNTPVNDDEWHHVALVVTEGANLQVPATQFYLDGLADTTNSGSDTPYNLSPDYDVRIGMSGPLESRFFTGLIDEVRLYDRALSSAELLWLAGKTAPIDKPF